MSTNELYKKMRLIFCIWCMIFYYFIHTYVEDFFHDKFGSWTYIIYKIFINNECLQGITSVTLLTAGGLYEIATIKRKRTSAKRFFTLAFFIEAILLVDENWQTASSGIGSLSVFTILAVLLLVDLFGGCLKWLAYQNYDIERNNGNAFVVDRQNISIIDSVRKRYADSLVRRLRNVNNKNEAFSVAIYGDWGAGKTVFLTCMSQTLRESGEIVIEYNPWNNLSSTQMLNSFFDCLSKVLSEYDSSLEKPILKYAEVLTSLDVSKSFVSIVSSIYGTESTSIYTFKEDLKDALGRLGQSVYVIIDDLDRLASTEIFEVVRLIRNTANFPYLKFIVACDRQHIFGQLGKMNISPSYLEKIFMMELSLPNMFDDYPCVHRLKESVEEMTDDSNLTNFFELMPFDLSALVENTLGNIRQAERFARGLVMNWAFVKENVDSKQDDVRVSEFVLIELLRLIDGQTYSRLYSDPRLFFDLRKNMRYKVDMYVLKKDTDGFGIKNNYVLEILKVVFHNDDYSNINHASITLLENYDKYFTLGKPFGHVSKTEFIELMNSHSDENVFVQRLSEYSNTELRSIFNLLYMLDVSRMNKTEKKRFIDMAFALCQAFNVETARKIVKEKLIGILTTGSSCDEVRLYLLNKLESTGDSYRKMLIADKVCCEILKEKRTTDREILDENKLLDIVRSIFVRFVDRHHSDASDILKSESKLYSLVEASVLCYPVFDIDGNFDYEVHESLIHSALIATFDNKRSTNRQAITDFETIDSDMDFPQEYFDSLEEQKEYEISNLFGNRANYDQFKEKCFEKENI